MAKRWRIPFFSLTVCTFDVGVLTTSFDLGPALCTLSVPAQTHKSAVQDLCVNSAALSISIHSRPFQPPVFDRLQYALQKKGIFCILQAIKQWQWGTRLELQH